MLKVLLTTKCIDCGKELDGSDMRPPFITPEGLGITLKNFYGNRVKRFIIAECNCGKQYIALLAPHHNGYKIIDLAIEDYQETKGTDPIDNLNRNELILMAKKLGIEGNAHSIKSIELIKFIKENTRAN